MCAAWEDGSEIYNNNIKNTINRNFRTNSDGINGHLKFRVIKVASNDSYDGSSKLSKENAGSKNGYSGDREELELVLERTTDIPYNDVLYNQSDKTRYFIYQPSGKIINYIK